MFIEFSCLTLKPAAIPFTVITLVIKYILSWFSLGWFTLGNIIWASPILLGKPFSIQKVGAVAEVPVLYSS